MSEPADRFHRSDEQPRSSPHVSGPILTSEWSQRAPWLGRIIGFVILVIASVSVYAPSLHYEMIFDDLPGIVDNESIHTLFPLFGREGGYGPLNPQPETPFTARPLVSLSLAINHHFGGLDPFGYRVVHVVLHIAAGLLLWGIVWRTLNGPRFGERFRGVSGTLSFAAAMLWTLHPVHTETVIYLSQRTELMMGVFYLLTLYCSLRYWSGCCAASRWSWLVLATLSCALGMLSKEMMASVPAMVFLYEWVFIPGSFRELLKRSWLLYVCLCATWLLIVGLFAGGYVTPLGGFNNTVSAVDWWTTQANVFFVYWKLTLWPWPLVLNYHVPIIESFSQGWPGICGLAIYAVLTTWLVWRRSPIGFGLIWFFAVLSPTLIVPLPSEELVERRLYVPVAAITPLVVVGLYSLVAWWLTRSASPDRLDEMNDPSTEDESVGSFARFGPVGMASLGVLVVLSIYLWIDVSTIPRLKDRQTIWVEVLKHDPHNPFAVMCQGSVEYNNGNTEKGLRMLKWAYDHEKSTRQITLGYAGALEKSNRLADAIDVYREAVSSRPNDAVYQYNLAHLFDQVGKLELAEKHYLLSIDADSECYPAHNNLGLIYVGQNRKQLATKHFEAAAEIKPDFENCMNLMNIYLGTGQTDKAAQAARMLLVAARAEGKMEIAEKVEQAIAKLESLKP